MEEKKQKLVVVIWPEYEEAKFRCPRCKVVLTLTLDEVAKITIRQYLECWHCEHSLRLGDKAIEDLCKRDRCKKTLKIVMAVTFVVLVLLSIYLAVVVSGEAGAFAGVLGAVILAVMRDYCMFGKSAILLNTGKRSPEKKRPIKSV